MSQGREFMMQTHNEVILIHTLSLIFLWMDINRIIEWTGRARY